MLAGQASVELSSVPSGLEKSACIWTEWHRRDLGETLFGKLRMEWKTEDG